MNNNEAPPGESRPRAFDCDHPGPADKPCAVCGIGAEEWPNDDPRAEARRLMMEGTDSDTGDVWLHRRDADVVFAALRAAGSLSAGPLDVERLARARHLLVHEPEYTRAIRHLIAKGRPNPPALPEACDDCRAEVAPLAAEYTRLGSGATSDGER